MQVTTPEVGATAPAAEPQTAPRARRRRSRRLVAVLALVIGLCGSGIGLYLNERDTREETRELGIPSAQDWVELEVTAQDVDPAAQRLTLYVTPVPHGSLALGPDSRAFARPVEITAAGTAKTTIKAAEGEAAAPQVLHVETYGGTATDYPFDRYRAEAGFTATSGGTAVPVGVAFTDVDPFFVLRPEVTSVSTGSVVLEAKVTRSRSTFILSWFMIAAMWALALAVLGAAEVLYRKREGLIWPSLGWMAATIFALIGMRNAAPGSPPIGSLIDYVAFFWAEGIIAASLTCTVMSGIRTEHQQRREREAAVGGQ
ncbi:MULTISPECIES: DUF4436 family protein [unclassified Kitasatospora]|uniref:DUF4436 family protein n=1 Tax=unclassified Kitasatospora TaxID=2633591 RepID=UPI0033C74449